MTRPINVAKYMENKQLWLYMIQVGFITPQPIWDNSDALQLLLELVLLKRNRNLRISY